VRKLRRTGEQGDSAAGSLDAGVDAQPHRSRRLHLLRHAKSSWKEAELADHARPLSPRGLRAAEQLCRFLAGSDIRPDVVLCSTAVRAHDTPERVLPALGAPRVLAEPALYHAAADSLLELVRALPDDAGEAMLVGHNPGLEGLVVLLAAPGAVLEAMAKFPTGALATLESAGRSWRELEPGSMTLTGLVLPRALGSREDP
jgi:phosphohistidine phosphatase